MKNFFFVFLICFQLSNNSCAQQKVHTTTPVQDEIKAAKDNNLVSISFESNFDNDSLFLENSKGIIVSSYLLSTNHKIGLAKRIWVDRAIFPIRLFINSKGVEVLYKGYKYIFVRYTKIGLNIEYSNKRGIYR